MKKQIFSTLVLSLTLLASTNAVYSETIDNSSKSSNVSQNQEVKCPKDRHGHKGKYKEFIVEFLKEKKGMTDKQIQAQLDSGKTLRDILKEKNVKHEELEKYMLERKYKKVDEAVKNGEITKEEGKKIKENIKERMLERKIFIKEKENK